MEFIKLSLEEELAVVTIDRPKSLNALNSQVYREIIATLRQVEAMDQVKVVILTGAGEKAFAAGADIVQMVHEDAVAGRRLSGLCHEAANLLESMRQVTIAAVNGFALGAAVSALACDLPLLPTTPVRSARGLGIIPGGGGSVWRGSSGWDGPGADLHRTRLTPRRPTAWGWPTMWCPGTN